MRLPRKSLRNYVPVSVRAARDCYIYSALAHGVQLQATTPSMETGHSAFSIDHRERCVMPYDQFQRTFVLSSLANWVSTCSGSQSVLQADCQQMLIDTFSLSSNQKVIGDWQLVWGPQVWQAPDSVLSGNVMYVAHTAAMPGVGEAYVVALSATNPRSLYDWFGEDFDVASSVDFASFDPLASSAPVALKKPVDPQGVTISMGTATGVWHLLNMVSPQTALAPNTTLVEFLQALGNTGATVIFTGHSLAGALSPTLTTWLKTHGKLDGFDQVYCYPTAGATPGNAGFAALFAATLPSPGVGEKPYQIWNADLWNTLDCVPHAWEIPMLNQIRTLYGNAKIGEIDLLVDLAILNTKASTVSYCQIDNQSLTGTSTGIPTDIGQFLEQMKSQHTTAYDSLIAEPIKPVTGKQQCQQADAIEQQARDALIDRLVTHARQIEASDVQDAETTVAVLESMANTLFKRL
ncbi:lipase family protein [Xanthomonas prunicola]|uniref:lipase family protein n=1 Tax=Xanthomonas prunicola TaxID=2053930 RepID=UPI0021B1FA70|nr:lipase family protein [Xanthomonas prunicola]UXA54780.1 lipase family protein [Xanthomonas prunicola]